jgi:hypothetical protein
MGGRGERGGHRVFPLSYTHAPEPRPSTHHTRVHYIHPTSRQREFVVAQLVKNVVVAGVCGTIFFGQGKEEALPTFSNSSFNVSSLWYFAMLYTVLSCLQIIPQLFFYKASCLLACLAAWLVGCLVAWLVEWLLACHGRWLAGSGWR